MRALNADDEVMRNLTGRPADRKETDAEWSQRLQERSDRQQGLPTAAERRTALTGRRGGYRPVERFSRLD